MERVKLNNEILVNKDKNCNKMIICNTNKYTLY